ncbi:MAG: retroviral-like aspartic protease family protein [Chloroflexi bacterium]|nr:retroviral-like aspartic protease family protein [Chloroflexota bacterium]
MSDFRYPIAIGSPDVSRFEQVEALVDTGSSYTWVPRAVLERLGVKASFRMEFETADGRIIERDVAETQIRVDGRTRTRLVVFGDEGTTPLLGADTLQGCGLAADPVRHRLIPVPGLLMTL